MNGGPAVPIWIVPDADLKKNGGTWAILGQAAVPITGSIGGGDVSDLTATGYAAGQSPQWDGADFVPVDYYTEAEADARYGQLGAANTWALAQTFTGQALGANGTAALPAYSFSGDPNTGIYTAGVADTLSFSAGGSQRAWISTTELQSFIPVQVQVANAATNFSSTLMTVRHNSTGTPATNFGSTFVWQLQSTTTANQNAVAENVYWVDATHASRSAAWDVQGVYNATALAAWLRARRTGVAASTALWLFREATGAIEQVLEGAADSGGAGRKALTVAN
jgi:hypothetical protein